MKGMGKGQAIRNLGSFQGLSRLADAPFSHVSYL